MSHRRPDRPPTIPREKLFIDLESFLGYQIFYAIIRKSQAEVFKYLFSLSSPTQPASAPVIYESLSEECRNGGTVASIIYSTFYLAEQQNHPRRRKLILMEQASTPLATPTTDA
ncbi:unnamed protein product [Nesidiocoris tenuis]|uniref:Uncharacterized protein n=1 Tax=Nesidiocoris tenuis TaxID=355587 RepID=A0A6H5H9D5_9HEMI|nr:unnamed protein product [Nesidiocoris tenuis]